MRSKILWVVLLAILGTACKKDFLTRLPLDQMDDATYWTNENNVRTFAYGFYPTYFPGYGRLFALEVYFFSGQPLNDDFAPTAPVSFTKTVPASATGTAWDFTNVRKANIMLERVRGMDVLDEATRNHWMGVARFFRAMAYFKLVKTYGDVQWYGKPLEVADEQQLYKPRDSRTLVMDSVLLDLQFAADNIRGTDGEKGLNVTKWVALAFMSRIMLFEGTWQKYHQLSDAKSREYLEAAKWAANEVITKGGYSFSHNYRESFNSADLAPNKEIILYRRYAPGMLTHSLMSYNNKEPQTGPNKNLIETYLCTDGLPIGLSPLYQGDRTIENVLANRDSRMLHTFNPELRPNGSRTRTNNLGISTTGYCTWKFLDDALREAPTGESNLNVSHAPVIRLGEVMLNYAEAAAELGGLTQEDLDKSINKLRARTVGNPAPLPPLQVLGGEPAVNGAVYHDPKKDPDAKVTYLIWEIRRERRVEFTMEGSRFDDLRRWRKLDYMDTRVHTDLNRGAWIKQSEWLKPNPPGGSWLNNVTLEGPEEGYIIPSVSPLADRIYDNDKVYLEPIPQDQIKLFSDKKVTLSQNKGW